MKSLSSSSSFFSHRRSTSFYLVTLSFLLFVAILYGEDFSCIIRHPFLSSQQQEESDQQQPRSTQQDVVVPFAVGRTEQGCNMFAGTWVYDEETRPQYEETECPYIQSEQTCQAHGRPDKGYLHWRWQPQSCSLPSFNATFMLENLRDKRIMYVGDSLNRGQFISMVCLLQRAIPEGAKSYRTNGSLIIFKAEEYNTTVEFYWAPFLVESNSDNAIVHRVADRIVRAGSINKHARHWRGADVIVFNTYVWWLGGLKMKILRGSFQGDMKDIKMVAREEAFRMVLKRMLKWVEKNMDPHTTRTFFTSMSPMHEISAEWGDAPGGNCYNQTRPISDPTYWGYGSKKPMMQVMREEFGKAKAPITLLNITQLSEYRRDAHTSIYKRFWNKPTPEQLANPVSYADCVHWCLPGLPDTWNELLYAKLFFP